MRKLSFKKGLLPRDGLGFSGGRSYSQERILELFTPKEVVVPMLQHIGTPAVPCVAPGSSVEIGSLIGRPTSHISAPVHAGISGIVTAIETIRLPNGAECAAVRIQNDLKRRTVPSLQRRANPEKLSVRDLKKLLLYSGIVGMGGDGYPAAAKCRRAEAAGVHTLFVNGLQCEPYLTSDVHILREHPERVVHGAMAFCSICKAQKVVICIEDKWKQEIDIIETLIERLRPEYQDRELSMTVFKSRFPQGYDKLLIKAVYGIELTENELIEERGGAVVFNASTCAAFWEMAERNQPSCSRIITIAGDLGSDHNVLVPIGTTVSELLEHTPGRGTCKRIVVGGALTGAAISDLNTPVIKTTQGLTLIKMENPRHTSCIHCGSCVEACPVGLLPYMLNRLIELSDTESLIRENIDKCISCGACSYVCPAGAELSARIVRAAHKIRTGRSGTL